VTIWLPRGPVAQLLITADILPAVPPAMIIRIESTEANF
jgi:hypothetical protein